MHGFLPSVCSTKRRCRRTTCAIGGSRSGFRLRNRRERSAGMRRLVPWLLLRRIPLTRSTESGRSHSAEDRMSSECAPVPCGERFRHRRARRAATFEKIESEVQRVDRTRDPRRLSIARDVPYRSTGGPRSSSRGMAAPEGAIVKFGHCGLERVVHLPAAAWSQIDYRLRLCQKIVAIHTYRCAPRSSWGSLQAPRKGGARGSSAANARALNGEDGG